MEGPQEKEVEYRDIDGFNGYRIGDDGSVWSKRYNKSGEWKRLKPIPTKKGRLRICFSLKDGGQLWRQVHHLVLEAFVGPRPEGMDGLHWDDDNQNNHLGNLRWGTPKENKVDAKRNHRLKFYRGNEHPMSILKVEDVVKIRSLVREGSKQTEVARMFGVSASTIWLIIHRKNWSHIP